MLTIVTLRAALAAGFPALRVDAVLQNMTAQGLILSHTPRITPHVACIAVLAVASPEKIAGRAVSWALRARSWPPAGLQEDRTLAPNQTLPVLGDPQVIKVLVAEVVAKSASASWIGDDRIAGAGIIFSAGGFEPERRAKPGWIEIPRRVISEMARHYTGQGSEQERLQNSLLLGKIAKALRPAPVRQDAAE